MGAGGGGDDGLAVFAGAGVLGRGGRRYQGGGQEERCEAAGGVV